ncbi:arsenate reductase family protein [Thioclava sp. FR2]|uniref:arsenate reductase family protein n=1 Tax=Thioclava sp. FR2 TaxID=3445780 RepID=UPI003EB944CF
MILYGIPTCDTCKKAMKALKDAGHDPQFRDVRAQPLSEAEISAIVQEFGDRAINKTSPTYRSFNAFLKESDPEVQIAEQPTVMKRPVIEHEGRWTIAWDEAAQSVWLG